MDAWLCCRYHETDREFFSLTRESITVHGQSNRQRLVALNFRVPLDLRRRLKVLAASRSTTMTNLLLELLERLEQEESSRVKRD